MNFCLTALDIFYFEIKDWAKCPGCISPAHLSLNIKIHHFFLTREQLILSPLDPHTGTHYNYLESGWFPGRGEKWKTKIQSNKKEWKVQSLGNGNWWKLPWKSPPGRPGCHPRSQICSPCLTCRIAWGRAPREYRSGPVICMQQGCTRFRGKGKGQRPVNLKRESNQCSRSFHWVKNRKAMSINTCISKLLQPVLSIPCNLFLSCTMMPESKSHLPPVIIAQSQQETCSTLLHPLQPSTT